MTMMSHHHHEAFLDAIEAYLDWDDGAPEPTVELRDQNVTISRICGLLWNCTDWIKSADADRIHIEAPYSLILDAPPPRTYGQAARLLKAMIAHAYSTTPEVARRDAGVGSDQRVEIALRHPACLAGARLTSGSAAWVNATRSTSKPKDS